MLCWGGDKKETTITTAMQPNLFRRGDRIQVSGFINNPNNGLFVVRRAKGAQYIMAPAGWWDYVTHYATKFWNEVRWHFWGMVDSLEDAWDRLLESLKRRG
jgi:hypothetical protein